MGRKSIIFKDLDPEIIKGIKEDLEVGVFEKDAAILNGVPPRTFRFWKKHIPEFKQMVRMAILGYKRKVIATINVNSIRSGKTGLEILRRRWPEEWNIPTKIEHKGKLETGTKRIADLLQRIYFGDGPKKNKLHSDVS